MALANPTTSSVAAIVGGALTSGEPVSQQNADAVIALPKSLLSRLAASLAFGAERALLAVEPPHKTIYLAGNFAPVKDELRAEKLEVVEGKIPDSLDGCYVRNGG